ncbi:MAG: formate dehydrogenase subunit gamma [Alphaproteobacteria bacterium]
MTLGYHGVTMTPTGSLEARVLAILARHAGREGALLPVLHDVQAAFGCVPGDAVPVIAKGLNLSRAEVHGVVTFYHDFRSEPAGRRQVRICRGEACQAMGADAMAAQVLAHFRLDWDGTTEDGAVTVSPIFCLGLCSVAPAVQVGEAVHARVSAQDVISLAEGEA